MERHLHIDCDVLVYESAFAAQKTVYTFRGQDFENHKAWLDWAAENEVDAKAVKLSGELLSRIEYLDESTAATILRTKLNRIFTACDSTKHTLYLTGKGNYRDEVAVTKGYKANRKDSVKPLHYQFVKDLCLSMGAMLVNGREADDAMGCAAVADNTSVICTIDKDLNMIPGRHYDWNKGLKYKVDEEDSHRWFLRQLLTGDATDNIPGLPKYGEVKANKILDPHALSILKMWTAVYDEYSTVVARLSPSVTDFRAYLEEQAQLLWIQRKPDERWSIDYYRSTYVR